MAAQVHRDHGVPLLVGHVEQHPVAGDAGIVHHDVQSAQPDGAGEQFVGRRALADITGYRDGLSTSIGSGGADLVDDVGSIRAEATSLTTTVAPNRARPSASARPKPAAAPVTTATFRTDRSCSWYAASDWTQSISIYEYL